MHIYIYIYIYIYIGFDVKEGTELDSPKSWGNAAPKATMVGSGEVLHPSTNVLKIHDHLIRFRANSIAQRRSYLLTKILLGFPTF